MCNVTAWKMVESYVVQQGMSKKGFSILYVLKFVPIVPHFAPRKSAKGDKSRLCPTCKKRQI
jgi:hypothetical protein